MMPTSTVQSSAYTDLKDNDNSKDMQVKNERKDGVGSFLTDVDVVDF